MFSSTFLGGETGGTAEVLLTTGVPGPGEDTEAPAFAIVG